MLKGKYKEYSILIETNEENKVNPLVKRGLVKLYLFDKIAQLCIGEDFPHKYKSIEEAIKSINKQENIVMYLHYDIELQKFISSCDVLENMSLVGLITCSKRVIRTVWHELQRAKKEEVVNKAISVIESETKVLNDWISMKSFNVKIFKNDEIWEDLRNILAYDDEMLLEKIEILSMTPNIKELLKNIK